jgi:hypothetical protein
LIKTDPYAFAAHHAEEVIRERGIAALPVDPIAIAGDLGIEVQAKPAGTTGVSGMFLRAGESYGIVYATHIYNAGFQRFSVAHELGHYFLPGHIDAVLANGDVHQSRAGFASGDRYEREADYFAAALLMPRGLLVSAMRTAGAGLAAIEHLATLCATSLTATAIRLAQCTPDPLAIIVSVGSTIEYCFMSDSLKELDGIDWIRKHQVVPRRTPTFAFNQDGAKIRGGERADGSSDLQEWFGGPRSIEVVEDVVGLGSYGKSLTVLYDFILPDEDEEAAEESLHESWTPTFHR